MDEATKERIASSTKGFDFVLHDLCLNEDWNEVSSCVKIFETTAKVPRTGDLPLHLALSKGCPVESVASSLIVAYPESTSIPSSHNQYPLLLAMGAENSKDMYSIDFLKSLINRESTRGLSTFGESALMTAITKEFPVSLISALLTANPGACKEADEMDNLPIHEAVEKGNKEVVKIVYEAYPEAAAI
eukprot:CAMPEP_0118666142 /NCGR_PEP_ID=MMETSP0785-20121206/19037_1 /TAXON_ID=91992 /ORGANISM="Bolidomonas pacifica, Strain CCMP 1866" /LENGTH=187 /DNA_ID=CAMNT_0006560393 /DNA_START=71 /DNA_END=631 /DNA_ORIENTATION=-